MKATKYGKGSYYKRNDPVWPWGYYIPPNGLQKGQSGLFVCSSEQEAKRQLARQR
jgi:hypothetical protein